MQYNLGKNVFPKEKKSFQRKQSFSNSDAKILKSISKMQYNPKFLRLYCTFPKRCSKVQNFKENKGVKMQYNPTSARLYCNRVLYDQLKQKNGIIPLLKIS